MRSFSGRRRWRWIEEFDMTSPRPADYVIAVLVFLVLCLLFVWERNHAIVLNRQAFQLQEQLTSLGNETDLLASRATALADRQRIVQRAEELGMIFPQKGDLSWIYYVPTASKAKAPARSRVAGFVSP
jgi:cell division protein FtsL